MRRRIHPVRIGLMGAIVIALWLAAAPPGSAAPTGQGTPAPDVFAEALGEVNLRHGPGIEYLVVGQITAGTRYRVLARHSYFPWLQLDYPDADQAWVYSDLVQVTGNLALVPVTSEIVPLETPTRVPAPTRTLAATPTQTPSPTAPDADAPETTPGESAPSSTPTAASTATATITPIPGPIATTLGEANIRFGPDISYPSIVKVEAGSRYRVLEFHAVYPWVHIDVPESPTGTGWIFRDVVEISGDTGLVPYSSAQEFRYPTLTPTPQAILVAGAPWNGAPAASGDLASTLGRAMLDYLLEQNFAPYSDRFASVFVLDLQSGDTFSLNGNIAYSGMSLTKIPILAAYFQRHSGALTYDEAFLVADTMMCSENLTTNQLLELIGEGDPLRGAQRVTAFLQNLNLGGTFIMRQYRILPDEPEIGVGTITTGADQDSARPDAYNQVVPSELGWLLGGIYQCARDGSGLLMERYPGDFTVQECRQMLAAMDANVINVFLEAGVPRGTQVLHKHGWVDNTHGDAGIVIGPDRAYVFVATLFSDTSWLEFDATTPVIGELSRLAWNAFNPANPVPFVQEGTVPGTCDPASNPVMQLLLSASLPAPGP